MTDHQLDAATLKTLAQEVVALHVDHSHPTSSFTVHTATDLHGKEWEALLNSLVSESGSSGCYPNARSVTFRFPDQGNYWMSAYIGRGENAALQTQQALARLVEILDIDLSAVASFNWFEKEDAAAMAEKRNLEAAVTRKGATHKPRNEESDIFEFSEISFYVADGKIHFKLEQPWGRLVTIEDLRRTVAIADALATDPAIVLNQVYEEPQMTSHLRGATDDPKAVLAIAAQFDANVARQMDWLHAVLNAKDLPTQAKAAEASVAP